MFQILRAIVFLSICLAVPYRPAAADPILTGSFTLSDYNRHGVTGWFDGTLKTLYGGLFTATFDGEPLIDIYCVQADETITTSTYGSTIDKSGIIHGQLTPNAGGIAWLMVNIAPSIRADLDKQNGLQGALWSLSAPAGHSFSMSPTANPTAYGYYESYLLLGQTNSAALDLVSWISPYNTNLSPAQGLVAAQVPEPGTFALLAVAAVVLAAGRTLHRARP
jgi:hypothetical protein